MFTGIVEAVGQVLSVEQAGECGKLEIAAASIQSDLHLGDSVATNGVCLTVSQLQPHSFIVDVMPVSWQITTLGSLQAGSRVNIERALRADARLGGHFVTGHIDGVGTLSSATQQGNATLLQIEAPKQILCQLVNKGSIAVDGVSLTVHSLTQSGFGVSIIPHTGQSTILSQISIGQKVNLETDILGKYCQALLKPEPQKSPEITEKFLQSNGFF